MLVNCLDVTKRYKKLKAIDQVNLTIDEGKIIGLIGNNGAGKTTLLNMIAGLKWTSSGSIEVFGEGPMDNGKVLNRMFFARDSIPFHEEFTIKEVMTITKTCYPLFSDERYTELLERFKLDEKKKIKKLSKGMKTLISIILSSSSGAEFIIYDEPTEGLDASNRKLFYQLLIEESKLDKTILLSSHLLSELDMMLEEIILIHEGQIMCHENIDYFNQYGIELEGKKSVIEEYTHLMKVLDTKTLGEKLRVVVARDQVSEREVESLGIRTNPVSCQDICVYLSESGGGKNER